MKVSRRVLLTGGAAFAAASLTSAQERRGLKLFMNCDMEGSSGIFTGEQAWWWENGVREEVAREARELFTADINAASAAALEAGATELIVCDTHHGGGN
jgi:D-aminopeptidase